MNAGDLIEVTFLHEHQLGFDSTPFFCIVDEINENVDGWLWATSVSSGVQYDLDPTQFKDA